MVPRWQGSLWEPSPMFGQITKVVFFWENQSFVFWGAPKKLFWDPTTFFGFNPTFHGLQNVKVVKDILPSEYIKVSYFWPKSAKKLFCLFRASKKTEKIFNFFENLFHKTNSKYLIWIVPKIGVPQITLEGSRDQSPSKLGLKTSLLGGHT